MNGTRDRAGEADGLDARVGARLRDRRLALGLSVPGLAEALGLPERGIQAVEAGQARLSPSRLCRAAGLLNVPVSYFFEPPGAGGAWSLPGSSEDPDK